MKRNSILLLLSFLISTVLFGQRLGDYYVSISSDSTLNCRLRFLNDTDVELSNIPRHMSRLLTMTFKWTKNDTTIEVLPGPLAKKDSASLIAFGFGYFIKPIIKFTKIEGGFIDYSKSLIYIRQKDFGNNPYITYIIDGKTFIQDVGITDGYGIIKKNPKKNKALKKKLKNVNKDNCTIEIIKGLEAYKRYGIKGVYGVIVITTKQ